MKVDSVYYADVIVDISTEKLDRTFQYKVPRQLEDKITEGVVVTIPFGNGNRLITGYVVGLSLEPAYDVNKMKSIHSVETGVATVEARLIALAAWMRENYGSTMIQALKTVLPVKKEVKKKEDRQVRSKIDEQQARDYLAHCRAKHYVAKARAVQAVLEAGVLPYERLTREFQVTATVLKGLIGEGILVVDRKEVYRAALTDREKTMAESLTEDQRQVAENIVSEWADQNRPCLIHGITGSGKTQVYMELISRQLQEGRQVIVLIPEIALTAQMVERFLNRFGSGVSFLNSRMTAAERYDQFKAAKRGDVQIMVGPRSALFTPFSNLGLIIMDEEHETSYISETVPRYHAREVAIQRARMEDAHVVMGSATPSVDAYYGCQTGKYVCFTMTERFGHSQLPKVQIIDMRQELKQGNRSILSMSLQEAMEDRLARGEQIMLFLNRRGYAGFVSCRSCGETMKCPHCDISFTEHTGGRLVCHYCGYEKPMPKECPTCGSSYIGGFRAGTQQIETLVQKMFPQARVLRMDLDSTKGKEGHAKILKAFGERQADILIGTQMIVKGHDFPGVTLVGVLAADMSLNGASYRASERTFQLITQAVGRAGRGELKGQAFIQTYHPDHYAIQAAAQQDYERFYNEEIAYRMLLDYPPAGNMVAIRGSGASEEVLQQAMEYVKKFISRIYPHKDLELIGPAPESIGKIKDVYKKVIYCKHAKYDILVMIKDRVEQYVSINSGFDNLNIQFDFHG